MPQEVIYYLSSAFVVFVVVFTIDYWSSESMTLSELFIDFLMALAFPLTLVVLFGFILSESDKIFIKKPKKKNK